MANSTEAKRRCREPGVRGDGPAASAAPRCTAGGRCAGPCLRRSSWWPRGPRSFASPPHKSSRPPPAKGPKNTLRQARSSSTQLRPLRPPVAAADVCQRLRPLRHRGGGEDLFGSRPWTRSRPRRPIQDRHIVIRRFAAADDYRGPCQILVREPVSRRRGAGGDPAETAGSRCSWSAETAGFCQQGGIANFYVAEDRIRFEINADAARHAELRLDAQLLKSWQSRWRPAAGDFPRAGLSNR